MNSLKSVYQSQSQFPPPFLANDVFTRVLQNLAKNKYDSDTMLTILDDYFSKQRPLPGDFPLARKSYTRTLLLQEKSGFQIMMSRWDKGSSTPIHGHPRYSLLYVIEGDLFEQFYLRENKRLMEVSTLRYKAGDYSYNNGDEGRFDNAIHRITAVKSSLSLHIYSDDALRGEVFHS